MSGPGDATLDDVNPQPAGALTLPNRVKLAGLLGRIFAAGFCVGLDATAKWGGATNISNATKKRVRERLFVEPILVHNLTTSVVTSAEKPFADPSWALR